MPSLLTSFSDCVEANIIGIHVADDAKTISISIRRKIGRTFTLKAEGVDRFVANEFRELLAELVSGKYQQDSDPVFDSLIDQEIAAIARGEKILVEIEPVYGVWVVILAQRVLLYEKESEKGSE